MADNHSLNYDVRELKLGASFTNNKASQYHTIKYDFKPASVDVNKMASVDVGTNHQVTVTVPHLDGAGVPQTVFKGNQRPYTKECVLIIDRATGEITLEKLSSNIQVKKTRQELSQKQRPLTPLAPAVTDLNTTQRSTSRTRVATNRRTHAHPAAGSNGMAGAGVGSRGAPPPPAAGGPPAPPAPRPPASMLRSPPRVRTSPPQAPWSSGGNSTLASLPMIGLDDLSGAAPPSAPPAPPAPPSPAPAPHNGYHRERQPAPAPTPAPPAMLPVTQQDDSSSSSSSDSDSDSGSGSGSDSDSAQRAPPQAPSEGVNTMLPNDVLNDDLCLSESGSDSD